MKHILIAYTTKSGSTGEVAGAIGKELSQVPVACFLTALSLTETQTGFDSIPVYQDPSLAKPPKNAAKLSFKERYATVAAYLAGAGKGAAGQASQCRLLCRQVGLQ